MWLRQEDLTISLSPAWVMVEVQGQQRLQDKTLSQKKGRGRGRGKREEGEGERIHLSFNLSSGRDVGAWGGKAERVGIFSR